MRDEYESPEDRDRRARVGGARGYRGEHHGAAGGGSRPEPASLYTTSRAEDLIEAMRGILSEHIDASHSESLGWRDAPLAWTRDYLRAFAEPQDHRGDGHDGNLRPATLATYEKVVASLSAAAGGAAKRWRSCAPVEAYVLGSALHIAAPIRCSTAAASNGTERIACEPVSARCGELKRSTRPSTWHPRAARRICRHPRTNGAHLPSPSERFPRDASAQHKRDWQRPASVPTGRKPGAANRACSVGARPRRLPTP